MADGKAYAAATDEIAAYAQDEGVEMIVGPEARGFIVGCPVAYKLGIGFAPAHKKGKLPRPTVKASYDLEYGEATLYLHKDAIKPGQRVLVCDDFTGNWRHDCSNNSPSRAIRRRRGRDSLFDRAQRFAWARQDQRL